jgi:hypothetical protein
MPGCPVTKTCLPPAAICWACAQFWTAAPSGTCKCCGCQRCGCRGCQDFCVLVYPVDELQVACLLCLERALAREIASLRTMWLAYMHGRVVV